MLRSIFNDASARRIQSQCEAAVLFCARLFESKYNKGTLSKHIIY